MKHCTIGFLAHVDAGKTTLTESLLYTTGKIRKLGRVDHGDAFLDYDAQERKRGITIYAKQAILSWKDVELTLLDTPGHVDFSAEMERVLQVLDYAVVIINGMDGVQTHTETIWKLLAHYHVPVFVFVNKMDSAHRSHEELMQEIQSRLSEQCVDFHLPQADRMEAVAMCSDELLEAYTQDGAISVSLLQEAIAKRKVFPCFFGSALKQEGMETLLDALCEYTMVKRYPTAFAAQIYKISRDEQGNRLTHMKIIGGSLKVKTRLLGEEKVDQIRRYHGTRYTLAEEVVAGEVCAVKGLNSFYAGEIIGETQGNVQPQLASFMNYKVVLPKDCDIFTMRRYLQELQEEDPQLHVSYNTHKQELRVRLMGEIQIEVLKQQLAARYQVQVDFEEAGVVYKETIRQAVEGVGHYEPLRHYAEVHLLLEPLPVGSGIVFDSVCPEAILEKKWQRLIQTHVEEKEHLGVLSGSPITDMKITLLCGRAHQKHTEGGDFRQAVYRAIRHGLKCGDSVLLEPYYDYRLHLPASCISRAVYDLEAMHASYQIQDGDDGFSILYGSAPVAKLQHYQKEVVAYTHGVGKLFCTWKDYEPCVEAQDIIEAIGYDSEQDSDNPCGSIFCRQGAGFYVPYDEVVNYMHMQSDWGKLQNKKESYRSFQAEKVDEKELEAIFERTYGPQKPRLKKMRQTPKKTDIADKDWGSVLAKDNGKPQCLLVDGYNVIHAWEELKAMADDEHMDGARMRLIDIMNSYQGAHGGEVIVVFDAYKVPDALGRTQKQGNIYVVYTKQAQTADSYIEQATHRLASQFQVIVATSDGLEQLIASGQGAYRMSSRQLKLEVQRVLHASAKAYEATQKQGGAQPLAKLRDLADRTEKE